MSSLFENLNWTDNDNYLYLGLSLGATLHKQIHLICSVIVALPMFNYEIDQL